MADTARDLMDNDAGKAAEQFGDLFRLRGGADEAGTALEGAAT